MTLTATHPALPVLSYDGEQWTGDVPEFMLSQLNELMQQNQRQHYTAYDIAREVLPLVGLDLAEIDIVEDDGNEAGEDT